MQEPCQGGGNETHSHLARSRPSTRKTLRKFKNAIKALKIKNPITAPKSIPAQKQSLTIKTRNVIIFHNWRKNFMYTIHEIKHDENYIVTSVTFTKSNSASSCKMMFELLPCS
jgi:hypothetical protein